MIRSTWYEPAHDWSDADRRVGLPTDAQVERLAHLIDETHAKLRQADATADWRRAGHRAIGIYGERHMARVFGVPMDLRVRPHGNARKNLVLRDGTVVDVVTRSALRDGSYPDLTRKIPSRGKPDVLVLVVWYGRTYEPEIGGWITDARMREIGVPTTYKDGITNLVVPIGLLDPIHTLVERHDPASPYAIAPAYSVDIDGVLPDTGEDTGPGVATAAQPALFDAAPLIVRPVRDSF